MIRIAGKVSRYIDASMNRATPTKLSAGAHDAEQQSAWPGARREARVVRRTSREARIVRRARHEKAHVATCVQAPRIKITQLSIIR